MTEVPATLFHYCSNSSFLSMLTSKRVVASALSLSNDSAEGKWIGRIFSQKCRDDPQLAPHHEKLVSNFESLMEIMGGLGFCLSAEGDLLSQWRGYADNGAGVSVGFNTKYLQRLTGTLARGGMLSEIIYDPFDQSSGLAPMIDKIKTAVNDGAMRSMHGTILAPTTEEEKKKITGASHRLWLAYLDALPQLYTYKNPAFREEREWRLIYYMSGSSAETPINLLEKIDFRAKDDRIIPFQYIDLIDSDVRPILEVILGPRNITPEVLIASALRKYGFDGVQVTRSAATYR